MKDWFKVWFDTDYYHILYKYRDELEARKFITNLCEKIHLASSAHVLDLACGRGRHARILAEYAGLVTGFDISASSIDFAVLQGTPGVQYFVHDMRKPYGCEVYDAVFNLFTSFGYFDTMEEHVEAIHHIYTSLKAGGLLILDYLNAHAVKQGISPNQIIETEGISFEITKYIEGESIVKQIVVNDAGRIYTFFERVRLFNATLLQKLIERSGLIVRQLYGDIHLNPFSKDKSDRVILIAEKP
ncbi:MAG: SAM-dependent methyltransferase [Thermaurantimonas sp.]